MEPSLETVREALEAVISATHFPEETIGRSTNDIHRKLIERSKYVRQPNFEQIHTSDLQLLFDEYDAQFFAGLCLRAIEGRRLTFRLSPRMTRTGGTTTRFKNPAGETAYEIAIASGILFDQFDSDDRGVTVCGLPCANRLDALQRIFEHEMVHLAEHLCWETSDCRAPRFRSIAARFFSHRAHTHALITRPERAAASGVRIGAQVSFVADGVRFTGRVNRITNRATVLVESSGGTIFSDGRTYRTFYVPLSRLTPVAESPATP